jgi:hypothetical protein
LKAVRLAVLIFLLHLGARNVLLHEDNQAVSYFLAGLTSRSLVLMEELRRLCFMLDNTNIYIRLWHIRSGASTRADKLSRNLDTDDWQLHPQYFTR